MVLGQGLIGIIALICAIWVIHDVWTNQKKMKKERKIIWTVLAVILSIITAIAYYFIEKK
ncbi:PLDc N-terminal domain-containing protein [Candidatus Woesearchaeota archaeon]|nr:PLDc N-terminal domain-containing protein [Candidatus Woesearchaeota archaeon]